jgi:hypothetical protein
VVADPGRHGRRAARVRRVLDLASVRERGLLRRALRLALLFALPRRELRADARRTQLGDLRWGLSPALLILIFPLGFRLTCYYYRKAYYRGFWASPPACGVSEPHQKYSGETRFPLILQNIHRYFFYAALPVAGILTYDTVLAFRNADYEWGHMGLGTLVFLAKSC